MLAHGAPNARPTLTITSMPPNEWQLRWSAVYSDWILETTDNIASVTWDAVLPPGTPPFLPGDGFAYVLVAEFQPGRFFRLRKP